MATLPDSFRTLLAYLREMKESITRTLHIFTEHKKCVLFLVVMNDATLGIPHNYQHFNKSAKTIFQEPPPFPFLECRMKMLISTLE